MPFTIDNSKSYLRELLQITRSNLKAIGWQSLTVNNTAGGVSLTVPSGATYALIVVESTIVGTPAIRYLECGNSIQAVSSTVGIPRSNLDAFDISGTENLVNFRAIQVAGGTHTLSIQYYR